MAQPKIFALNKLTFNDSYPGLDTTIIESMLPSKFKGREHFIDFYSKYNGGYFDGGAFIYRDLFYKITSKDHNLLEIESFHYIETPSILQHPRLLSIKEVINNKKISYPRNSEFFQNNIPFAGNCGDNDFWLDTATGIVKYTAMEDDIGPNNAILVAPSFLDFYTQIQGSRRN